MESQTQRNKDYCHYNHTDPCNISRWTARECYQFMYSKPWQRVLDFYFNVVNGNLTLAALFGSEFRGLYPQKSLVNDDAHVLEAPHKAEQRNVAVVTGTGRWARVTYKIVVSYHGSSFDGWQKQPGLNTVQSIIEKSLGKFVDEKKAKQLKDKGFAVEGSASVAGRTDKGVTALQQVCSFYTWRTDVKAQDIEDEVNNAAPGKLCVVSVSRVMKPSQESRMFHPNFSAKWRRYFYIFPLNDREDDLQSSNSEEYVGTLTSREDDSENFNNSVLNEIDEVQSGKKPTQFSISRVNLLLRRLEGKLLSYKMFARDTKASRADGPPTECFVYCARAVEARLPCPDHVEGIRVMCVELVANRFLRKMVRVLVATSIREAAAGAEDDALLKLMDATCRRATAPPAPPDGLCLVDVGYTEFDLQNCIIPS